tara:strand:+ start:7481 stop:7879 length:399 start_codon:yes stop_codon:yes gene_type:complete
MKPGAGIIIVRQIHEKTKVLALIARDGVMDIPKGIIDPGESSLEAALRETKEEAGITNLNFVWGNKSVISGDMTCYVAQTTQDPVITPHPHTLVVEHIDSQWVDWDVLEENTYAFLKPCIKWAKKIVASTVL